MNVLVYDGVGVSQTSLSRTIYTLKKLLAPRYAIQTVTAEVLNTHPWAPTCALLVFPGGRDVPYLESLTRGAKRIQAYVKNGGSYLGLCAGAYFASSRVEWEVGTTQEVAGDRPLGFFPGICEGCTYKGFKYNSEAGASAISIQPLDALGEEIDVLDGLYYNGGGHFVDGDKSVYKGVSPLLRYIGGDGDGKIAAVSCVVGRGIAVLSGVHIEYPLFYEPAASALHRAHPSLSSNSKSLMENARNGAMLNVLRLLRMHLRDGSTKSAPITVPLPQLLSFTPAHREQAAKFMHRVTTQMSASSPGERYEIVPDQTDTYHVYDNPDVKALLQKARGVVVEEEELPASFPKVVAVLPGDQLLDGANTPLFSIATYFDEIEKQRTLKSRTATGPGLGDALLYGEVVTSTQTLLDRNPNFLRALPSPLVSLATHQIAGRGRGGNVWVTPAGCLTLSFTVRPPPTRDTKVALPTASLVFVQYIAGLAVTETCREILGSEAGSRVRLKWPNDIYAAPLDYDPSKVVSSSRRRKESTVSESGGELKKLGGVLVSTNFLGGEIDLVVGIGLNVLNQFPTTSLAQLVPGTELTLERTAAVLTCTFERMWEEFVAAKGSFESFNELYLERWLHSDQVVTLATTSPPLQVRLVGITPDHGMLRTVRDESGQPQRWAQPEYIDLQPDGNSFDMLAGLIRAKR